MSISEKCITDINLLTALRLARAWQAGAPCASAAASAAFVARSGWSGEAPGFPLPLHMPHRCKSDALAKPVLTTH